MLRAKMVSVLITTYDSAKCLDACLDSVFRQDCADLEVLVVDNASTDGTREILRRHAAKHADRLRVIYNDTNVGFAAAQNQGIAQARGQWLLSLNPDVLLSCDFIFRLVAAGEADPRAGAVCGKLLRWTPDADTERTRTVDSTGIYFVPNLRHFDRGSEEPDRGQYDTPEYVFGATGAAALYRRAMVEDVSVGGEFFDEDFFAYREDADLAWRAQLLGWRCIYTPAAIAWHVRRVTPERFHQLPEIINRNSIKNRFLMRAKNISLALYLRLFFPITARDALILGYCLLREPRLLGGFGLLWSHRAAIRERRRWIQSHRRVPDSQLRQWFSNSPRSFPLEAPSVGSGGESGPVMIPSKDSVQRAPASPGGVLPAPRHGSLRLEHLLGLATAAFLFLFALAQPVSIAGAEIAYSTAAFFWILRLAVVRGRGLHRSPLDLPILFYLVFCAASAAVSPLQASSWEGMRKVSLIFLALLVAHNVPDWRRARQLLALLFLAGLASVGWGIWQYAFGVGLRVHSPAPGSAFARAGVEDQDVIMRVDGHAMRRPAEFDAYLKSKPPDEGLELRVVHGVVGADGIAVLKASVPVFVPPRQWPQTGNPSQLGMRIETARPARAMAFYSHYVSDAFVLELLASVAFGLWLGREKLFSRTGLLMAGTFLVLTFALGMTLTRAAWVALAFGCAVQAWFRFGRWFARLALPIGLALAIAGTSFAMHRFRGTGLYDPSDPGTDYRMLMWRDGLRLIREHPVFGVGMNVVRDAWWQFHLAAYEKYNERLHFHSTPIQIAVESGLPALLAWIALMACYCLMLVRLALRAREQKEWFHFGLTLGILGGTLGFLGSSLVQYDYGDSVVVLLFWFLMGLALAEYHEMGMDRPEEMRTFQTERA